MYRIVRLCLGVFLVFSLSSEAVRAAVPRSGVLDFAVIRNGKEIGSHVFKFESAPEGLAVKIQIQIKYKFGFITLHRFNHVSHELWRGGSLVSFSSSTSEKNIIKGRTKHKVAVDAGGDDLNVRADNGLWQAPSNAIPASLWNDKLTESQTLIDTVDGGKLEVSVEYLGDEVISVNGRRINAHYYRLSGDMERELWYDRENVLVRVQFTADDGSQIKYVLR